MTASEVLEALNELMGLVMADALDAEEFTHRMQAIVDQIDVLETEEETDG